MYTGAWGRPAFKLRYIMERIFFPSGHNEIEGLLELNSRDRGVVITHPHPVYGGNMYNPVVEVLEKSYRAKGYSTLRFNFRGVGKSSGKFENGIGEQEDVRAAESYLKERQVKEIDLAGYSFGTYVNVGVVRNGGMTGKMVMVSPPVAFMEFGEPLSLPCLKFVVTGSRDEIAPAALLFKILPQWNPEAELRIIEGADHFYTGCLKDLETALFSHS